MNTQIDGTPAYLTVSLKGKNLLEASAGTGKTFTVALLYLRAILGVGTPHNKPLPVESILVVTFTNAATEELIDRIRQRIKEAITSLDTPGNDQALNEVLAAAGQLHDQSHCKTLLMTALSNMSYAKISTIHSFCASLCQSIAINAGFPMNLNQSIDDDALQLSLKDVWRENIGAGDTYYRGKVSDYKKHSSIYEKVIAKNSADLTALGKEIDKSKFLALLPDQSALESFFTENKHLFNSPYNDLAKVNAMFEGLKSSIDSDAQISGAKINKFAASNMLSALSAKASTSQFDKLGQAVYENPFFSFCDKFANSGNKKFTLVDYSFFKTSFTSLLNRLSKEEAVTGNIHAERMIQLAADASENANVSRLVREQIPLAIIDEFQDTDPHQYRLFSNIYSGDDCGLLMVGDPKQAIYAFRGGDIFTYLKAKQEADQIYRLPDNFRSADAVVAGMNAIFEQPSNDQHPKYNQGAFNHSAIDFTPVNAKAKKPLLMIEQDGVLKPLNAVEGIYLPDNAECQLNSAARQRLIAEYSASYIEKLLTLAGNQQCFLLDSEKPDAEKQPLQPGDIALLVNSHSEAKQLKTALLDKGIASLTQARESIYKAPEAYDIWLLLRAINEPTNHRHIEAALLAPINGLSYLKVHEIVNQEELLQAWIETFHDLHQLYLTLGPFVALARWLGLVGAMQQFMRIENDRQATNVMQILELLQEDYAMNGGGNSFLSRFEQAMASDEGNEESLMRLESDEARVKIITIHASKGLEYPVVMVPYAWRDSVYMSDKLYSAHDEQGELLLGFSDAIKDKQKQALRDEKLRLFYVALTRASRHLVLYFIDSQTQWDRSPSAGYNQSPLGWYFPTASKESFVSFAHAAFISELAPINQGCLALEKCDVKVSTPKDGTDDTPNTPLKPREFTGNIDQRRGTTSFSMITRGYSVAIKDDDETGRVSPPEQNPKGRHALARGAHIGNALHNVLEYTDFRSWQADDLSEAKTQLNRLTTHELKANGVVINAEALTEVVPDYVQWLTETIQTPFLTTDSGCMSLAHLTEWKAELTFTFALQPSVSKGGLRELLSSLGYSLEGLSGSSLYGMLTGAIDLVFCHEGKYYLADYKSNHLGDDFDAYDSDSLAANNDKKAYTLQYLIYSLALHLYLTERLDGYDYAKHFGGVFYLYLRGMHPDQKGKGVFFHLPTEHTINQLSQYFLPASKPVKQSIQHKEMSVE